MPKPAWTPFSSVNQTRLFTIHIFSFSFLFMRNFSLKLYSAEIQEIAEIITSILALSVTVVDASLNRIAGTGLYENQIGDKLPDNCVFAKCLV
jgi:hypothetical protein